MDRIGKLGEKCKLLEESIKHLTSEIIELELSRERLFLELKNFELSREQLLLKLKNIRRQLHEEFEKIPRSERGKSV